MTYRVIQWTTGDVGTTSTLPRLPLRILAQST